MDSYDSVLGKVIKPEYEVDFRKSSAPHNTCHISVGKNNRIFNFLNYIKDFIDIEFYRNYFDLLDSNSNVEGIITGLSYFEVGIESALLKKRFVNMALSSQDLYYDLQMLKYSVQYLESISRSNITQAIVGLSNYSFRYDLSMTKNPLTKDKPKVYYPILKDLHNYNNKDAVIEKYDDMINIINDIFQRNYLRTLFDYSKSAFYLSWDKMINRTFEPSLLSKEEEQREIYLAERWNQLYPITLKENIEIFRNMLEYLKGKRIKVAVVTNPVTNFHKKCFPTNCREEFLNIIKQFEKDYNFTFIDGFSMSCFMDSDFYDGSHLNKQGARKFTRIINQLLE